MKKYLLILLVISSVFGLYHFYQPTQKEARGTVIILNGPSAAGKSTIQKAFQERMMPNLWCKVGIDNFLDKPFPDITPDNLEPWLKPNPMRWVETTQDADGNNVITVFFGEQGQKVIKAMNSAIAAYANEGCDVIVDYIAYDPVWVADLQRKLKGIKTYWVAVDIPLEVLEEREKARGTSPAGHARSHYDMVHGTIDYDLRVNSHESSSQEIAEQLQSLVS